MAKHPNDDLFEGTKMTFGEHLEELRKSLFKAIVGMVLMTLVSLFIADRVVGFIQMPLRGALENYYATKARETLKKEYAEKVPPQEIPAEMLELMATENVLPEFLYVEPSSLLTALAEADPERFSDLPTHPHRFVSDDIDAGKLAALCSGWRSAALAAEPSAGKSLWALLSKEERETISRIAKETAPTAADGRAAALVLNHLVDNERTAAIPEWEVVSGKLADDIAAMRAQLKAAPTPLAEYRLRRFLLANEFSEHLRTPRLNVVRVTMWKPAAVRVQALKAEEAFMIWMKAGLVFGLILSSPWVFRQIWNFVAAGLYPHEKRYVFTYLPMSLGLFLAGVFLAFFFVFRPVLDFLFTFNRLMNVDPDPRIGEWLGFVLILPIGFGVAFQLPLVMLLLNRIGVISIETYLQKWRIAILAIFVISMVLTPADPISMLLMAIPLTVLYFGGVLLCKYMPGVRNPFAEGAYEP